MEGRTTSDLCSRDFISFSPCEEMGQSDVQIHIIGLIGNHTWIGNKRLFNVYSCCQVNKYISNIKFTFRGWLLRVTNQW